MKHFLRSCTRHLQKTSASLNLSFLELVSPYLTMRERFLIILICF
ncbi:hypothetical protein CsSME_00050781 [Camellia sinensis var. sinensis]